MNESNWQRWETIVWVDVITPIPSNVHPSFIVVVVVVLTPVLRLQNTHNLLCIPSMDGTDCMNHSMLKIEQFIDIQMALRGCLQLQNGSKMIRASSHWTLPHKGPVSKHNSVLLREQSVTFLRRHFVTEIPKKDKCKKRAAFLHYCCLCYLWHNSRHSHLEDWSNASHRYPTQCP